jgi:predicted transcriptional regulator
MSAAKTRRAQRVLSANVYRLRCSAELTQQAAAERAGIHWRHWQKIEAGEVNPTLSSLVKIANALRVDVAALLAERRAP